MKIQDLQGKPDGFLIQEVLRATAREVGAVEMKPGYNNGPPESNQRIRLSDETGTMTAYLTGGQEIHVGDLLDICAARGQRGVSGAALKHSKGGGQPYIALYARGVRVAGVSRQQASGPEDPWFMAPAGQPAQAAMAHPPQQQPLPVTQASRPSPTANGPHRWTSTEIERSAIAITERIFNGLADSEIKGVSCDQLLACAQALASTILIGATKNDRRDNEVPSIVLVPEPVVTLSQEAPPFEGGEDGNSLDWGDFGGGDEFKS